MEMKMSDSSEVWQEKLPEEISNNLVALCLTTAPPVSSYLSFAGGKYFSVEWDSPNHKYRWRTISESKARELAEPVQDYRGMQSWKDVFPSNNKYPMPSLSDFTPKEQLLIKAIWKHAIWRENPALSDLNKVQDEVWPDDEDQTQNIRSHISRINQKLNNKYRLSVKLADIRIEKMISREGT
jgi:hypothetical protein